MAAAREAEMPDFYEFSLLKRHLKRIRELEENTQYFTGWSRKKFDFFLDAVMKLDQTVALASKLYPEFKIKRDAVEVVALHSFVFLRLTADEVLTAVLLNSKPDKALVCILLGNKMIQLVFGAIPGMSGTAKMTVDELLASVHRNRVHSRLRVRIAKQPLQKTTSKNVLQGCIGFADSMYVLCAAQEGEVMPSKVGAPAMKATVIFDACGKILSYSFLPGDLKDFETLMKTPLFEGGLDVPAVKCTNCTHGVIPYVYADEHFDNDDDEALVQPHLLLPSREPQPRKGKMTKWKSEDMLRDFVMEKIRFAVCEPVLDALKSKYAVLKDNPDASITVKDYQSYFATIVLLENSQRCHILYGGKCPAKNVSLSEIGDLVYMTKREMKEELLKEDRKLRKKCCFQCVGEIEEVLVENEEIERIVQVPPQRCFAKHFWHGEFLKTRLGKKPRIMIKDFNSDTADGDSSK